MSIVKDPFLTPLTLCIDVKCLTEGFFINELKLSRVCPIFKKGSQNIPGATIQYRPYLFLGSYQVVLYFENNKYFNLSQFGFRRARGKRTVDALIMEVLNASEIKDLAQATLCHLSKVFDCDDHNNLILKFYGISQGLL